MKGSLRLWFGSALCVLLLSGIAWAQATAQLNGRVTDASGAVLPGVTVTATQTATDFKRTVVTDETGIWIMPNLPTGPYRLDISLQGFKTYSQTGIVLAIGANPTINATLTIGTVEETITVPGGAPLVDVRSAAGVRSVVSTEQIVELPLQGRQVTDLVALAGAGVNTGAYSNTSRDDAVGIVVAGGLRNTTTYNLDGAMHNDVHDNSNMPFPFPDALQEFSVNSSGLSAENGEHSGAAVSAVTKSGSNRFSGNGFEFFRDAAFNATSPLAPVVDGKRANDGLVRNQFGGTLGGPIVKDKLFFFGGVQSTITRQTPPENVAFIPSPAMLAGDFTAIASAACNNGTPVTLRTPFVGNRINPALLDPVALNINSYLPKIAPDDCGRITYGSPKDINAPQFVAKVDYQSSAKNSMFVRWMHSDEAHPKVYSPTHNVLTLVGKANRLNRAMSTAFGDNTVLGSGTVNSFRVTWNGTGMTSNIPTDKFFDAETVGVKNWYSYVPGTMTMNVTNGFAFSSGSLIHEIMDNNVYRVSNDLTLVRGRHQIATGVTVGYWKYHLEDNGSNASFSFSGQTTGMGLADLLIGQASSVTSGAPSITHLSEKSLAAYAQDSWIVKRVTVNYGFRWEPFFGPIQKNDAIPSFVMANFQQGIRSSRFVNAPLGFTWAADPGAPARKTGWKNVSPRLGVAWDVSGDGRTAVRSSYAINYDFPASDYYYTAMQDAPFGTTVILTGVPLSNPFQNSVNINPIPLYPNVPASNAPFPASGSFQVFDPNIESPRTQSWNVSVERQLGATWRISASYLGSYNDRIWNSVALNPGNFLGTGPCTLNGVSFAVCTTNANLNQRRTLSLANPAANIGNLSQIQSIGEQTYRGLLMSVQRRAANGLSLSGNYAVSHCQADTVISGIFVGTTTSFQKPGDPRYDMGHCNLNRTHILTATVGYQTPEFAARALRVWASNWRLSSILSARSGGWLNVTTSQDLAFNGIASQRVNQVLSDPYGDKTINNFLNPAAFALPTAGTLGNEPAYGIEGPGYQTVDLAVSRVLQAGMGRTMELRLEVFNLFNRFNFGDPVTTFGTATFGKILTQNGASRLMQFGVKFGF